MGEYVAAYGERAALLVAEEKYTQRVTTENDLPLRPRELTAEFALVKVAGGIGWVGFRDVVEVNGKVIVDRKDRLMRLLSDPSGDTAEARRISDESSRFNVGPISRNFNVPTTVLFFFHRDNLPRFSFTRKGTKSVDGVQAWHLDFKETKRPTMMMTRAGKDVPCEGTVWVVPADGTVVRTRVRLSGFADQTRMLELGRQSVGGQPGEGAAPPSDATPSRPSPTPTSPAQPQPTSPTPAPTTSAGRPSPGASSAAPPPAPPSARSMRWPDSSTRSWKIESLADIEVTYRRDADLAMWVPVKMSELYEGALPLGANRAPLPGRANCLAEYGKYKRFETSAKIVTPK